MKKLSKNNKGFTLVEMIVVLVILAILAAILIPGLLGYIDDAKQKKLEIHGKAVYTAAQAVASKNYATGTAPNGDTTYAGKVEDLSEIKTFNGKADVYFGTTSTSGENFKVQGIVYQEGSEKVYLVKGSTEWSTKAISISGAKIQINGGTD